MSFAFSAALFDDNNDSDFINNKRKHSKTQKNYKEGFDKGKVNSVLEEVHKKQRPDDDDIENEEDLINKKTLFLTYFEGNANYTMYKDNYFHQLASLEELRNICSQFEMSCKSTKLCFIDMINCYCFNPSLNDVLYSSS